MSDAPETPEKLYGKHRGFVVSNIDVERRGRLTIQVPSIGGGLVVFADPCYPFAGLPGLASGLFVTPPVGAGVFVEFLNGDIEQPIWSGGYPGTTASMPVDSTAAAPGLEPLVMQSGVQKITVSNTMIEIGLAGGPNSSMVGGIQIQPGIITFIVGPSRFAIAAPGVDLAGAIQLVPAG